MVLVLYLWASQTGFLTMMSPRQSFDLGQVRASSESSRGRLKCHQQPPRN